MFMIDPPESAAEKHKKTLAYARGSETLPGVCNNQPFSASC
jgi:hypothetical protein